MRNFAANAMHVAQQAYPTSKAVGNAVGNAVAPMLVLGGAGEALGAGGAALSLSGAPIMRAVAPTLARVSSAIGSGGFSTGKAINTIGQGVAALPYRVLGGATAGVANHLFSDPSDPNSLMNDAGAGAVTSALGGPVGKALGSLGRGMLERAFGSTAMVQGGKILRASVQNVLGRARLALENAQPGETAMQALTRQNVDAPVLAAMFKLNQGTSADGATYLLHKAETDLNQQALREASGQGQTATEAYTARKASEAHLNQEAAPLRSGALDDANVGNVTIPPLEKGANAAATSAADLSAQAKRMGGLADRQASLSTNPDLSMEAMNQAKGLSGLADQYSERAAAGSLEQGEIARAKQAAIDALRQSGYDKLSSQPILDNLQAIHDSPDIAANKPAPRLTTNVMIAGAAVLVGIGILVGIGLWFAVEAIGQATGHG
jgi:hypothetical protein